MKNPVDAVTAIVVVCMLIAIACAIPVIILLGTIAYSIFSVLF